jgi:hypothetical protein
MRQLGFRPQTRAVFERSYALAGFVMSLDKGEV